VINVLVPEISPYDLLLHGEAKTYYIPEGQ